MRRKGTALTKAERDVLVLVARGLTNREIADRLCTSTASVKTSIHQASVKLDARNRIEAVFFAMKDHTINVGEVYSLNELVELLSSLGPETVESMAQLLRDRLERGRVSISAEQTPSARRRQDSVLTTRERDVLALVARGLTNQEIADRLCTSASTVRTYLHQACIKLEARNRAQAFISAVRRSALDVDEVFSLDEMVDLLASLGPEAMLKLVEMLREKLDPAIVPSVG
jgi:DNA-binding NarL/FixJ family response regulator